jgi:SAM-dependent methyltransferase
MPASTLRRDVDAAALATRILACPACGRETAHRFLYAKNGCEILRCEACGIGRTETRDFDPASYYTDDYFAGAHADGYADYRGAEPVLRREFAREVAFIRKRVASGRLLDIGCAYGFFLQEAKPYFDVSGIEIAEDAAAHGRANGLNVLSGVATEENLVRLGMMDVIVLLDVIEHVPDPHETLALCAKHLNPGGIILLTTGDFASPAARLTGSSWRLMTPPQHLWFFTRDSMHGLAARLGLTLESFDHPWKIVPLSLIVYQLGRMVGSRAAAPGSASRIGVPVNLFDAMRVVFRKGA